MREWRIMLGPFLIWAAHFVLVYAIASVADVRPPAEAASWRNLGLALSAACIASLILVAVLIRSRTVLSPLATRLGLFGSVVGVIAVIWQSLPLLISNH